MLSVCIVVIRHGIQESLRLRNKMLNALLSRKSSEYLFVYPWASSKYPNTPARPRLKRRLDLSSRITHAVSESVCPTYLPERDQPACFHVPEEADKLALASQRCAHATGQDCIQTSWNKAYGLPEHCKVVNFPDTLHGKLPKANISQAVQKY